LPVASETPISLAPQQAQFTETSEAINELEVVTAAGQFERTTSFEFQAENNLTELGVRQHNETLYTVVDNNTQIISSTNIEILTEIDIDRAFDVVNNQQFVKGLDKFDKEFFDPENANNTRFRIANDTAIGVSISTTAGILAWALRGGAIFASVMAATPIWASIDPVRVLNGKREDDDLSGADKEVESYFDDGSK